MWAVIRHDREDPMPTLASFTFAAGVANAREADLALLRAHEPVVRYTRGELFLPTAVGPYVGQCGLWSGVHGGELTPLVRAGELTLERLSSEAVLHRDRPL